jgi:hypothetical protein
MESNVRVRTFRNLAYVLHEQQMELCDSSRVSAAAARVPY